MKTSESILAIAPALVAAQAIMEGAKKDHSNQHFKSKYAGLDSVVEAVKEALTSNGVAYLQFPCTTEKDEVGVETLLLHKSGEWILGTPWFLPVQRADAQGFGSALTYARRYSLMSACGIAPEDDDGNAAAKAKPDVEKLAAGNYSGKQVANEAFEALPAAQQEFLRGEAMKIMGLHQSGQTMHDWIDQQHYDTEEKLALWSLLPSDVRSAIKRQQATARNIAAGINA